jgi:hypothetical protein
VPHERLNLKLLDFVILHSALDEGAQLGVEPVHQVAASHHVFHDLARFPDASASGFAQTDLSTVSGDPD